MAHELEIVDGNAQMFYVGSEVPWHGLGTPLEQPPTVKDAIRLAGLDWKVASKPLVMEGTDTRVPAFANVRESDGKVLGVVGPSYKPLQNLAAFEWFQPFLDSGEVELHTAGSLRDGKRVWILAKIVGDPIEVVKDDVVDRFLLLSNSHDGTLAVRCGFSPIRVVCMNTLSVAHSSKTSKLLRVRHTDKTMDALKVVRDTMNVVNQEFLATSEQYKLLAKHRIPDLKEYVRLVFNPVLEPAVKQENAEDQEDGILRIFSRIEKHYEKECIDTPAIEGSIWAGYNAVTSFLTHERGRSVDTRLDSLWFGASHKANQQALSIGVQMAMAA